LEKTKLEYQYDKTALEGDLGDFTGSSPTPWGNEFVFHGNVEPVYVQVLGERFVKVFWLNLDRLPDERKERQSMINGMPLYWHGILDDLGLK
jgi:hypothetical protein